MLGLLPFHFNLQAFAHIAFVTPKAKQDILAATQKEGQENMHYRRAQVKFTVTGEEKKIYAWFDRMHSPDDFRVISELAFVTNREDDSLIDCVVTFDQWYVPLPPEI